MALEEGLDARRRRTGEHVLQRLFCGDLECKVDQVTPDALTEKSRQGIEGADLTGRCCGDGGIVLRRATT